MSAFTSAVIDGIERLKRADRRLRVFGAESHRYAFKPRLAESDVVSFEKRWKIRLPADYREFLIHNGNGGAGPFYGIFPLGYWDGAGSETAWDASDVGHPGKPFPHRRAWNDPPDESKAPPKGSPEFDLWIDREDRRYWDPALTQGSIPICTEGCALRFLLVVTGAEAGNVWHDSLADYKGLSPIGAPGRLSFGDWYLSWIEYSLHEVKSASR